jgi:DNA-binding response OmpR family regulator
VPKDLDILVVEDDPSITLVLREELVRDSPGTIRQLRDVEAAMELLDEGLVPDLVLLDMEAAEPEAMDLLRRLRLDPCYRYTAVVVTGSRAEVPFDRAQRLLGEVWIPKPFEGEDLAMAIRLALSRLVEESAEGLCAHVA